MRKHTQEKEHSTPDVGELVEKMPLERRLIVSRWWGIRRRGGKSSRQKRWHMQSRVIS